MSPSILVCLAVLIAGCAMAQSQSGFRDPQGRYRIAVPSGWRATPVGDDGVQIGSGSAYVMVLIFPGDDPSRSVAELARQFGTQWRGLAEARRGETKLAGAPAIYVTYGGANPSGIDSYLVFTAAALGGRTFVLMASAPKSEWARYKQAFDDIGGSFTAAAPASPRQEAAPARQTAPPGQLPAVPAAGPPSGVKVLGHTPPLEYERFTDPAENAFWAEVPRGWRVSGGLARVSPLDTRQWLRAESPDGIVVSLGNPNIPPFMVPNSILDRTGFREGSRYPNGFGGFYIVRRYLPGVVFSEEYVRSSQSCAQVMLLERRERPDLAQVLNSILSQMPGAYVRMNPGEVSFSCAANTQPMLGYCYAGTLVSQVQGGSGLWVVQQLFGFLAPAAKVGQAHAVLRRVISSYRQNPQWEAMQRSITKGSSEIMARSNAETSRMISESYWNRQRTLDTAARRDANARRGTTDVVDPNTGESWNITGGYNHYWRKPGSNEIIGTNTYDPPCFGCQPLSEY